VIGFINGWKQQNLRGKAGCSHIAFSAFRYQLCEFMVWKAGKSVRFCAGSGGQKPGYQPARKIQFRKPLQRVSEFQGLDAK
jgi:hypothetical protein